MFISPFTPVGYPSVGYPVAMLAPFTILPLGCVLFVVGVVVRSSTLVYLGGIFVGFVVVVHAFLFLLIAIYD